MKRVVASAVVNESPERVWELYADVPGTVAWVPFVEEVLWVHGTAGLGQSYRERTRLMRMSDVSEWLVVGWEAPRRQVHRSHNKLMDLDLVIELEADGQRTRVQQQALLRSRLPAIVGRLHEAAFGFVAESGLKQAVAGAKRRLEHDRA
ncbi:MAG TPA: SRPBCC family protein [Candidatus Limnocylindrales bacterium]|nr:SRPBCC family protein [Candidatus Limnocylindrales bacterium]